MLNSKPLKPSLCASGGAEDPPVIGREGGTASCDWLDLQLLERGNIQCELGASPEGFHTRCCDWLSALKIPHFNSHLIPHLCGSGQGRPHYRIFGQVTELCGPDRVAGP